MSENRHDLPTATEPQPLLALTGSLVVLLILIILIVKMVFGHHAPQIKEADPVAVANTDADIVQRIKPVGEVNLAQPEAAPPEATADALAPVAGSQPAEAPKNTAEAAQVQPATAKAGNGQQP